MARIFSGTTVLLLLFVFFQIGHCQQAEPTSPVGTWQVTLQVGGQDDEKWLPFLLKVDAKKTSNGAFPGYLVNGQEHIPVDRIAMDGQQLVVDIPHYASRLTFDQGVGGPRMAGQWSKRRGKDKIASVPCRAERYQPTSWDDPARFVGRWAVRFSDSEDTAVGIFEKASGSNQVLGTFLTTTGDYRFLAGGVRDGRLTLSCFDGGHAFLFEVDSLTDGSLQGSFHSGNWYQDRWTAVRDDDIRLPDAFSQTVWTDKVSPGDLKFPDLSGQLVSLDDDRFGGKCRIIEVFGSWCPNCHDAGVYLSELHEKYADRGLSIVGLAFELTGDFETDVAQVRTFIRRNRTQYPILIAGTSDKSVATQQLQVLDRVRSYPTMIFLDEAGKVRAIYTGFSGPATGDAHQKLRRQFEKIIEDMLGE